MAVNLNNSPARRLFTAEQWKRIEANPTARVDDELWHRFSDEQRAALTRLRRELTRDGMGAQERTGDRERLRGGGDGEHFSGRPLAIRDIQGVGAKSPYEGQTVQTTGIVTGSDDRGFYIQQPGVNLDQGSPGIYVSTGGASNVSEGDEVTLSGRVIEFAPKHVLEEDPNTSTVTQLRADRGSIKVLSSGNPVPEIVVGKGGVALSHTESNEELWEKLEGARVRLNDAVVTGPPNQIPRYADMAVVTDGASDVGKRTKAGGLLRDEYGNPYVVGVRMPVDDLPPVNIGARFPNGLVGHVVDRHNHHQVTVEASGRSRMVPSTLKPEFSELRKKYPDNEHVLFIASLNGENKDIKVEDINKVQDHQLRNVDDDVGDGSLTRMAKQIVANLTSPDIVALQEILDNDGGEVSDVVDASETWKALIEEIVAQGGPRYEYVDRPPVSNAEGGLPGGNQRTGFLYNAERVKLDESSVYRMEDPAFAGTRVPLVATFVFQHGGETERVTLSSVHNKSKRSGSGTADARDAQSEVINRWAKEHAPKTKYEHLGVFGDRNAYTDEPAIQKETAEGALELLSTQLPEEERYSTQFGGTSGELDHASVKTSVPVEVDLVNMNSDFDHRVRAGDHDGTLTAWDFRRENG